MPLEGSIPPAGPLTVSKPQDADRPRSNSILDQGSSRVARWSVSGRGKRSRSPKNPTSLRHSSSVGKKANPVISTAPPTATRLSRNPSTTATPARTPPKSPPHLRFTRSIIQRARSRSDLSHGKKPGESGLVDLWRGQGGPSVPSLSSPPMEAERPDGESPTSTTKFQNCNSAEAVGQDPSLQSLGDVFTDERAANKIGQYHFSILEAFPMEDEWSQQANAWTNVNYAPDKLQLPWSPINSALDRTIVDPSMLSFHLYDTRDDPPSSRSGFSELPSELSSGSGFSELLSEPPDEVSYGLQHCMSYEDFLNYPCGSIVSVWNSSEAYEPSKVHPSQDTNVFDFPQHGKAVDMDLTASLHLMNVTSSRVQKHSDCLLPTASGPTDGNIEIEMVPKSQTSASICGDSSPGFETDSTWSGEESDWGEDAPQIYDHLGLLIEDMGDPNLLIRPSLPPMKQALVDCIMREFWIIFNQEWSTNIQKHSEGSPKSTSSSISQHDNKSSKSHTSRGQKRERKDDEDENSEDNDRRNPKRPKVGPPPLDGADERAKFACPYRKHDRRKYCHQTRRWRSCALTPLDTIARVKGHLYRYHRIFQCPRCKTLHNNADALEKHTLAAEACEVIDQPQVDGITGNVEKKLRSRKKAHRDQSEIERWKEMYRILFPGEGVPSPFFESIQEDIIQSPDSEELTSFEEYSRRELPRLFQGALEAAIANEAQPIEERLRSQLVGMIQDCQDRVLSTYRARRSTIPPTLAGVSMPLNGAQPPLPHDEQDENALGHDQTDIVETLYKRPPPERSLLSQPKAAVEEAISKALGENPPSDSGYVSEPPALNFEYSSDGYVGSSDAIMVGSSQPQPQPQPTPNTPQPMQENRADPNPYQPFLFREPCTEYGAEDDFSGMPTSEFNGTEFDAFDLEKWMPLPLPGQETEQGATWSEWGNFQQ